MHNLCGKEILYKDSFIERILTKERNRLLKEMGDDLTPAQILYSSLDKLKEIQKEKRIEELEEFIEKQIKKYGKEQAIKNIQVGLNILNKLRKNSVCEEKNILKDDGILGKKTRAALENICKNYSIDVVKKYINKGALNNIIFNQNNNKQGEL